MPHRQGETFGGSSGLPAGYNQTVMTNNRYEASDLARGAYYAFEQSGLLLRDARSLYRQERHSSAAVLAVFGSEELGRALIYLERRRTILPIGSISKRELDLACNDHELKLAR